MSVIDEVTRELSRLPGIGPRTATRLVYHLMREPGERSRKLSAAIRDLADRIHPCPRCGTYTELELCRICSDRGRDRTTLCVVESAFEVHSIEKTGEFRGLFHVLGGRLSPLDGIGPGELNVASLLERIGDPEAEIAEIILATNPSVEGEATAVYLEGILRPLGVRVTRLARGLPMGSDLEYVDGSTLAEALSGRREM
ncbi:MAG: recombination protein RecR [Gemmatimonadales bacterium]|nr:MAG: recombination protein RecR [Gemmatimonadales bacterium]